jgi:hypothetical protein
LSICGPCLPHLRQEILPAINGLVTLRTASMIEIAMNLSSLGAGWRPRSGNPNLQLIIDFAQREGAVDTRERDMVG